MLKMEPNNTEIIKTSEVMFYIVPNIDYCCRANHTKVTE